MSLSHLIPEVMAIITSKDRDEGHGFLYRFDSYTTTSGFYDECGNYQSDGTTRVNVDLYTFPILKKTPCGCWIKLSLGQKRFVNLNARKQFACLSEELAKESFIARKRRQVSILSNQLKEAKAALNIISGGKHGAL